MKQSAAKIVQLDGTNYGDDAFEIDSPKGNQTSALFTQPQSDMFQLEADDKDLNQKQSYMEQEPAQSKQLQNV